jgi:hypothetical protein
MLFNPKWTKVTSPFEATLEDFISWLETKAPTECYDYAGGSGCLLGQFLSDHGVEKPFVGVFTWSGGRSRRSRVSYSLPEHFDKIACGSSGGQDTLDAALERARKVAMIYSPDRVMTS